MIKSNSDRVFSIIMKEKLVGNLMVSDLVVHSIIVAYNGVLTIVFKAFTKSIWSLKSILNNIDADDEFHLPRENIGTKWPKITIACLNDNQYLSKHQLSLLSNICNDIINNNNNQDIKISIRNLSIVDYFNRSLNPPFKSVKRLCLENNDNNNDNNNNSNVCESKNSVDCTFNRDSQLLVNEIVEETKHLESYYEKVTPLLKDNRNHYKHYNDYVEESSLVAFILGDCVGSESTTLLLQLIDQLKQCIESTNDLKNLYTWMPLQSLHISIRAI
ncbi:hypothetical protein PPL_03568 [Heterostelium album PN500]|uniref:Uncharacterized protein n=1 Tax=Heterostelium pallidum (strain ATCC 26659 / Pp 5 / PN500) TaxID=670386 RepID=D3B557_HETP5|nr:hypothetical protein PPL_03568 [Heterostelium album PN500]EFA83422.1 hypothetical protein PPL_03568 [Heterostelium album PN500]|eukprot:XP_020435539.1 hypothetical protein PPL_03568 [Heterostelium album PN500]